MLFIDLGTQYAQAVILKGQDPALNFHQTIAKDGVVDDPASIHGLLVHQYYQLIKPGQRGIGITQTAPFVVQQRVGNRPAFSPLAHNLILGQPNILKKDLVEG